MLFKGIDCNGFPEDEHPFYGVGGSSSSSVPGSTPQSNWFMGDAHTGIDDVAGVALTGVGGLMLLPGPTYVAAGAAGVAALKHPAGALVGMAAYAGLSLAVIGTGRALSGLD